MLKGEINVPVVVGWVTSVFHLAPVLPWSGGLATAWVPDLLAPDDVHDVEALVVLHDVLSKFLALGVVCL